MNFRNILFRVVQLNPRIHQDSINDVNQTRESLLNNRNNNLRNSLTNSQINCPICLTDSNLPIETNCGHIFCGIISKIIKNNFIILKS